MPDKLQDIRSLFCARQFEGKVSEFIRGHINEFEI